MANKPRMGSDPFQKKDPLGWIGGSQAEEASQPEGLPGQPDPPSEPEKPSKPDQPSMLSPQRKTGNPSKHILPSPPSTSDNLGTRSKPPQGSTTSKGLRPGWTRATFIVREETVQQLKAIAYWDRKELKRVVEEAFAQYIEGKDVPSIPEEPEPF